MIYFIKILLEVMEKCTVFLVGERTHAWPDCMAERRQYVSLVWPLKMQSLYMPNRVCLRKDSWTSLLSPEFQGRGTCHSHQRCHTTSREISGSAKLPLFHFFLASWKWRPFCFPRVNVASPVSIRNRKFNKKQWERFDGVSKNHVLILQL